MRLLGWVFGAADTNEAIRASQTCSNQKGSTCHAPTIKNKQQKYHPTLGYSLKPFVLLFDEIYTDLYRIGEAQRRMIKADKMVFMGTSFSVNITAIALRIAASNSIDIEIIDPNPIDIGYKHATYLEMSALEYVESFL